MGNTNAVTTDRLIESSESPLTIQIPEGAFHPDLDPMLQQWSEIASIAWEGFLSKGHGFVRITVEAEGVFFHYWQGAPCPCYAALITAYRPEEEAVIAVQRGEEVQVYRLAASPAPPESYAATPGNRHGMTAH